LAAACSTQTEQEAIHLKGNAQGSTFAITYYDSLNRDFSHQVDSILKLMDAVASNWDKTSLVQAFNNSTDTVVILKDSTHHFQHLLENAYHYYFKSDSVFDISIYPLLQVYGFSAEKDTLIESSVKDLVDLSAITFYVQADNKTIVLGKKVGQALDFNAYAQGYSVDVLAHFLEAQNVKSYIIELGGELRIGDPKPNGTLWTVGIDKPIESNKHNVLNTVELKNCGLATSGNYRKFKIHDGKKISHTFNALTKEPCISDILSCTVIAPTAEEADAWATIFMIWGKDKSTQFLDSNENNGLEAMLLSNGDSTEYTIWTSKHF